MEKLKSLLLVPDQDLNGWRAPSMPKAVSLTFWETRHDICSASALDCPFEQSGPNDYFQVLKQTL